MTRPATLAPAAARPRASTVATDDLGTWARQWDALALQAPVATPFLQSWWLDGAATAQACYLLVTDGDTLLGGLALDRRRRFGVDHFTMRTQGKLCPDHLDLVARPDAVDEVVIALRTWFDAPGSRVLDLAGLGEQARLLAALPGASVAALDVTVHEPLKGDVDAYVRSRSKSFRKQSRKFARGLARRDVVFRRVTDDEVPAAMVDFWRLHESRTERRELVRLRAALDRAVEGGLAAGQVRVHVAERHGVRGVVVLAFTTGNRLSLYQMARDLDPVFNHAGTVLDLQVLTEACADGLTEFDMLRGAEPYKSSFASEQRPLVAAQWAHGTRGRLLLQALRRGTALRRRLSALRNPTSGPTGDRT